jgi:hypothetical protein
MATISLVIVAGAALMIATMSNRRRMREMEHRERLAMIDRGLMPAPETDPAGFESATGRALPPDEPGEGYRTAGVLMVGLGFGLMLLIGVTAGAASVGIGIGGGWVIIGAASLINYHLITRRQEQRNRRQRWIPPSHKAPEVPPNVGP